MLEFLFYTISIVTIIYVFKENYSLKTTNKTLNEKLEKTTKDNEDLLKEEIYLDKQNLHLKHDLDETKKLKSEITRLNLLIEKIKKSYTHTSYNPHNNHNELDNLVKDEYMLLKDEENIIKDEEEILSKDNQLLKEENGILKKQIFNYEEQIEQLREATKHMHKYIKEISLLNNKVEELSENEIKISNELQHYKSK